MERSPEKIESLLLGIIRKFLLDSGAQQQARAVSLDASLERELGIGSLEKAELFHRIEKTFDIRLPTTLMVDAKQVKDLITSVIAAKPKQIAAEHERIAALAATQTDPASAETLIEVLQLYAKNDPNRPHIYLQDETGREEIIYYGNLYEKSLKTAAGIIEFGVKPGDTVAIMLPTSADFLYAFFGTLLAGAIPVPIYPPFRADQIEEYAKREALILRNAGVRLLITFRQAEGLSKLLQAFIPSLLAVTTIENLLAAVTDCSEDSLPTFSAKNPALIQYTSGSTGNPKGVLLTHANLIANMKAYGAAIQAKPTDVVVSWLPLYHDMGLIGAWLGSLYYGVPLTLLSPLSFLSRPERWLWAIHYHRATLSAGPNFAYELCIKKIDDADIEGLDLSSWRLTFNGAEMIYPKTIENFTKRFAPYGFRKEAFFPVYGLAECAVALAFPPLGRAPRIDRIQRELFETEGRALPAQSGEKNIQEFVSCGSAIEKHEIRIVDDNMQPVTERVVGNVQFRGPSAMQGYYHNPEATQAICHHGWLGTGDLGYFAEGELFITGRKKDLIIKAGRNYYPAEIEEIASQADGVRKGCVAAVGVRDAETGTEKLIVVAETALSTVSEETRNKTIAQIIDRVASQIGIPPDEVILVPPAAIPKTSSGKLRRSSCKQAYLTGKLGRRSASTQTQIIKLFFHSRWKKIKKVLFTAFKFLFTLYVITVVLLTVSVLWPFIIFLPRPKAAKLFHHWCRFILYAGFCPPKIIHKNYLTDLTSDLKKTGPVIFIANHASYLDTMILAAILPPDCCFVGKKELLKIPVLKIFIKKLDYIMVDRLDFSKSEGDAAQIKHMLVSGRSVVIFPEATFSYATGVRPFKSGAFVIAASENCPIYPIAIKGARKILRAYARLLKPSAITVTLCEPLIPSSTDWDEIVRLRDRAREVIAKHCGEQIIDLVTAGLPGL